MSALRLVLALPIFPARLQASIVGASELNFRVRDGNGWTLTAINTNLLFLERKSKQKELCAGSVRCDIPYRCLCRNCLGYSMPALLLTHCHLKDPLQILLSSLRRNRFEGLHLQNRTKKPCVLSKRLHSSCYSNLSFSGQALGLLVPVSCIHYCTSTSGLSTT